MISIRNFHSVISRLRFICCLSQIVEFIYKAEDIYSAAGWESMYQNGYLHGSPLRFSAKSAIYTAAGCQHNYYLHGSRSRANIDYIHGCRVST